ncbi:MAG: polysaccharide biosynthesis tyrosine autokinase [Phycisphaerae bacterium]|nr:polysaccharide biosynthesis tyrosine autokinase [Phycisphaerae bacterium]
MDSDLHSNPIHLLIHYAKVIAARKVVLIAMLTLAFIAGFLITRAMPKTYRATCLIQVKPETPDIEPFADRRSSAKDEHFLTTQFELIQSDRVVEEVVRKLQLPEKLHPESKNADRQTKEELFTRTVKLVSGKIHAQQKKDTDLIEISVDFDQPRRPEGQAAVWAANIANTIGEVFKEQTQRRSRETTEQALKELQQEIEALDERIAKTERRMDEVRERYNVTDTEDFGKNTLNAHVLVQAETARAKAEIELQQKRVLLEQIMSLEDHQAVSALPVLVQSKALATLVNERRGAEIKLSAQMRSLGSKHRGVERTRALIAELTNKINEEINGIRLGLQADCDAAQAAYDHIVRYVKQLKEQERKQAGGGYREFRNIKNELLSLRQRRKTWEESYIRERLKLRLPHTSVNIIQKAKLNYAAAPISPNLAVNLAAGGFLGLFLGIGIILLWEHLDTSVKTVEDVKRHLQTHVLGVIPRKVRSLHSSKAPPEHFEAYRVLRTNVKSIVRADEGRVICVTSAGVGEGKSLTLINLAQVSAQLGDRVLVVDSNPHRPGLHTILQVEDHPGLSDLLAGEVALADAVHPTSLPNLHLLPSGTAYNASLPGLYDGDTFKEVMQKLKQKYDWIFLDSTPMIGASEAAELVRVADAILMVVQHRKYPRMLLCRAREMVEMLGGRLLGVVLNNMNLSRDLSHYQYHRIKPKDHKPSSPGEFKLWRSDESENRHVGA